MTTSPPVPPLSLVFGYGAMLPLVAAGVAVWVLPVQRTPVVVHLALVWAGVILAFLSGVRRGLSFRTQGGPTIAQMAGMLWLFALAFAAFISPWLGLSCLLLLAGFISVAVLDPMAARRGEAPDFFAALRPPQMGLAAVSLLAIGARLILGDMP